MIRAALFIVIGATFALGVGFSTEAVAQGANVSFGGLQQDTGAPVEVTADSLSLNQKDGSALYTGNVIIIQGDMRLAAPRVLVHYSQQESKIRKMEATGGVVLVSGQEAAEAARADYDIENGQVVMSGDVLLTQGNSALTAQRMVVNLETGAAQMSGRVKTVLQQSDGTNGQYPTAPNLSVTEGQSGLRVEHLRKSYRKRVVIRDVTMRLDRGEVVALLGPNGSGKTTSFYTIAGLVNPDAGKVTIDGHDATYLPMYRRARLGIGYLPQEMSIFRGLSVEDNIGAVLDIAERDRHRKRERLEELLGEFSIEHLRRAPALALSGGERRRVEIARCLAANPKYLLLDEPFAGVDPISVGDIRHLVADLKTRGLGVLITDHNVRETLELVDRAYILHDGQVLMSGTPNDVVQNENVRRVYLGDNFKLA